MTPVPRRSTFLRASPALALAILLGAALSATAPAAAASSATPGAGGAADVRTVSGRVKSAASGVYLRNARVAVEGTPIVVLTDEFGGFAIPNAPRTAASLRVSYTGLLPESVALPPGGPDAPALEISLREFGAGTGTDGSVVKLDAFRVTTAREMSAADMAINEKRIAPNIREVIATDAFGTLAQDNLGDFLQYLPGVEVEGDGSAPLTVGLRGMPAEYTTIEMNGAGLSVPQTGGSTRVTALRGLTMSNVDRIEITKGPTPDSGADSIGGRINMIPRSAFERSRPELRYRTFLMMNSEFLTLRKTPGGQEGGDGKAFKWFPNFEVTYVNPVSKTFGLVLNASRNDYFNSARVLQRTFSTAGSSATAPYLSNVTAQAGHHFSRRSALGVKGDFRVSPRGVLSVAYNFNRYWVDFGNNQMAYATGTLLAPTAAGRTPATGDFGPAFTLGRPGLGSVTQQVTQNAYQTTQTHQGQVTYRYRGVDWDVDATVAKSKTILTYRLDSYGQVGLVRAALTGVTVRLDDVPEAGARDKSPSPTPPALPSTPPVSPPCPPSPRPPTRCATSATTSATPASMPRASSAPSPSPGTSRPAPSSRAWPRTAPSRRSPATTPDPPSPPCRPIRSRIPPSTSRAPPGCFRRSSG
jgi:iron complex outermembrane receptor protein